MAYPWAISHLLKAALQVLQSFPRGLLVGSCHLDSLGICLPGSWQRCLPAGACLTLPAGAADAGGAQAFLSVGLQPSLPAFPTELLPVYCLQDMHGTVSKSTDSLAFTMQHPLHGLCVDGKNDSNQAFLRLSAELCPLLPAHAAEVDALPSSSPCLFVALQALQMRPRMCRAQ